MRGVGDMGSGDMDSEVTCSEVMGLATMSSGDIGLEASMKASMTNRVEIS
jgi:hypothetical protein